MMLMSSVTLHPNFRDFSIRVPSSTYFSYVILHLFYILEKKAGPAKQQSLALLWPLWWWMVEEPNILELCYWGLQQPTITNTVYLIWVSLFDRGDNRKSVQVYNVQSQLKYRTLMHVTSKKKKKEKKKLLPSTTWSYTLSSQVITRSK